MAVWAPTCTLWPIWMRLSSFTPFSMTVSPRAPRSIVVFAPISTSSPIPHPAELGDLHPDPVVVGDAEAVGADDDSGMNDGPCADVHALADHDPGRNAPARTNRRIPAEVRARSKRGAGPDARTGFNHTMVADRCIRRDARAGVDDGTGRDAGRRHDRRGTAAWRRAHSPDTDLQAPAPAPGRRPRTPAPGSPRRLACAPGMAGSGGWRGTSRRFGPATSRAATRSMMTSGSPSSPAPMCSATSPRR